MKETKTICFFNSTKTWGGGEKWHFEMSTFLHSQGVKVLVIVSPNSELCKKLKDNGVLIEEIGVSKFSYVNLSSVSSVVKFYKKHLVYSVILNSSEDMKLGGIAAKKAGVKRVIYRRGSAIPIKNTFINRYFFRSVLTEVLANSEATKKTINVNNSTLFPEDKITVIPNSIDIERFNSRSFQSFYHRQGSEIILGNLGRMVFQKNQSFLIDVALELKKRNIEFKILMGGNGKLEDELKELVKKRELENEFNFLGFIDNPKSFMSSIDIFLLPSRWEGFGYVLAEAMLCKKPCIAFDISSNSQIIDSNKNGFLVPFEDINAFCDKIEWFSNHKDQLRAMGENGKEKIEDEFNSYLIQKKVQLYLQS